ncbi:MAG: transposase [Gemmatimonadaceae bacterium]
MYGLALGYEDLNDHDARRHDPLFAVLAESAELHLFAGEHLLCARLRPANLDTSAGAREEVQRIVPQLRAAWPAVGITLRADRGFCREALMAWSEAHGVDYVFGLARNERLVARIEPELAAAAAQGAATGAPARAATLRANQRRLDVSSIASVLVQALRRLALAETALARAPVHPIRLTLLTIGARVRVTTRKVWLALASGCPHAVGASAPWSHERPARRVHATPRRPPQGCCADFSR